MRTFVLLANNVQTDANWSLNSLPNAGRMDLLARCINSAFWLSHGLRHDAVFYAVLGGAPNAPVCLRLVGREMQGFSPDERNIASHLKGILEKRLDSEWTSNERGLYACRKSFEELMKDLEKAHSKEKIYWLTAGGAPLEDYSQDQFEDSVFILGDAMGPDKDQKKLLREYAKVSIGATEYLASHCICVINWLVDTA